MTAKRKHTLLAILAHPDDESFGMGGTLALHAARGDDVYLICATRGEAGDVDDLKGYPDVAALREAELRCAAAHLGLRDVILLGHRDSGMPGSEDNRHPLALIRQPQEAVVAELVAHIRRLRPDAILTFDPYGGYGHPDHIFIQQAATLAFEGAADAAYRPDLGPAWQTGYLFYHVFPRTMLRLWVRWLQLTGKDPRRFGRNGDIDLLAIAEKQYPVHVRVNIRAAQAAKDAASACHASQGGGVRAGWLTRLTRLLGEKDAYMQVHPQPTGRVRTTLFPEDA
jgi:LmbE family N-acetylglucosaminyl deacetylase